MFEVTSQMTDDLKSSWAGWIMVDRIKNTFFNLKIAPADQHPQGRSTFDVLLSAKEIS